jgi:hypothetical protein
MSRNAALKICCGYVSLCSCLKSHRFRPRFGRYLLRCRFALFYTLMIEKQDLVQLTCPWPNVTFAFAFCLFTFYGSMMRKTHQRV